MFIWLDTSRKTMFFFVEDELNLECFTTERKVMPPVHDS